MNIANCLLPTANCKLQTAYCKLQTAYSDLPSVNSTNVPALTLLQLHRAPILREILKDSFGRRVK